MATSGQPKWCKYINYVVESCDKTKILSTEVL